MKNKSIPELKKELLVLQSRWVKLFYSNGSGFTNCFTCGVPMNIDSEFCQTGHCFSKSGYPALQFNLDNLRVQCKNCNENLNGNEKVFKERLKDELGEIRFKKMERIKNDTIKLSRSELAYSIDKTKQKINQLIID